jgi:hypothetical protein
MQALAIRILSTAGEAIVVGTALVGVMQLVRQVQIWLGVTDERDSVEVEKPRLSTL